MGKRSKGVYNLSSGYCFNPKHFGIWASIKVEQIYLRHRNSTTLFLLPRYCQQKERFSLSISCYYLDTDMPTPVKLSNFPIQPWPWQMEDRIQVINLRYPWGSSPNLLTALWVDNNNFALGWRHFMATWVVLVEVGDCLNTCTAPSIPKRMTVIGQINFQPLLCVSYIVQI